MYTVGHLYALFYLASSYY